MACWYKDGLDEREIVVSSRIRLARNLADLPFSYRMTREMLETLKQRVKEAIGDLSIKLQFIEMDDVPKLQIDAMVERHVISPDFAKNCKGRAIAISSDESVSIMIGEEDHLRIQVISGGLSLKEAYEIADKLDTELNEKLVFAYDSQLGFLTECPTNIGTGLRASVMLHLPLLEASGEISGIFDAVAKIGLTIRGTYGEGSKCLASLYQVSNQITLGISETAAIENLIAISNRIVERENALRENTERLEMEDLVMRAYGIIKNARILTSEEFMKLISRIKLGISLGIIDLDVKPIKLLVEAQPSMLMLNFGVETPRERDETRAKMIRELV